MVSRPTLERVVAAADLHSGERVLEIGPGFGTLTLALLDAGCEVVAVELDTRLAAALRKVAAAGSRLEVVQGDIFRVWPVLRQRFTDGGYKLVANLPYGVVSQVLRRFLEELPRPRLLVGMVQREVAERAAAAPGAMSILSVAVQLFGAPAVVGLVPPEHFWPVPAVTSAILRVSGIGADPGGYQQALSPVSHRQFLRLVKVGFSARRKQLHNTLSGGLGLTDATVRDVLGTVGLDPRIRPQEVTMNQWVAVARQLYSDPGICI